MICDAAVILAFSEEVSVWVICSAAVILAFAELQRRCSVSDLWRRSSTGVCRGGVCMNDLWRRSNFENVSVWMICDAAVILAFSEEVSVWVICSAAVILAFAELQRRCSVSDLWRRSSTGVCRGGVCMNDLWRRSNFGVCRGGVRVSDQFYRRLQRRCLCEWFAAPQLYSTLQRRSLCDGPVASHKSVKQECLTLFLDTFLRHSYTWNSYSTLL